MSGYQENVDLAVLIVVLSTKTKVYRIFFCHFLKEKWRPSWIKKKSNIQKATFKHLAI